MSLYLPPTYWRAEGGRSSRSKSTRGEGVPEPSTAHFLNSFMSVSGGSVGDFHTLILNEGSRAPSASGGQPFRASGPSNRSPTSRRRFSWGSALGGGPGGSETIRSPSSTQVLRWSPQGAGMGRAPSSQLSRQARLSGSSRRESMDVKSSAHPGFPKEPGEWARSHEGRTRGEPHISGHMRDRDGLGHSQSGPLRPPRDDRAKPTILREETGTDRSSVASDREPSALRTRLQHHGRPWCVRGRCIPRWPIGGPPREGQVPPRRGGSGGSLLLNLSSIPRYPLH
jgi:hypothetical protein